MSFCTKCGEALSAAGRFCAACGAATDGLPLRTQTSVPSESQRAAPSRPSASHPASDDARFLPGNVVGERYRIVGLLGRGGMGEVYRADDLKLGQAVALKFLPETVEQDPDRLGRFLNEVRVALRITHPNVCRVHDIGEVDGQHFISMEYVDGEDLASLLRRIGRLPQERAVEIARQLCSGLAAAHDQGILHRDLKPANIMIDGRGRARITDFGLAGLAGTFEGAEVRAGTPTYMAPEQLEGREVTERSDLYALGLVLYEMFSGKPAFDANSVAEMLRQQQVTTPSAMSSLRDLDPTVEQAILRVLSADPGARPPSAQALAAALPGGDPLAAALAAGETPSPEMVADAGDDGGTAPALVAAALFAIVTGLVLVGWWTPRTEALGWVDTPLAIDALGERARLIAERLGYDPNPVGMAHGATIDRDYVRWLREQPERMRERVGAARPSVYLVWYRQSPEPLLPINLMQNSALWNDPPSTIAGMVNILVDPHGRLVGLTAVPPERDAPSDEEDLAAANDADDASDADGATWAAVFREAELDRERFSPVEPDWTPAHYADRRAAWEGTLAEAPDTPVRIEAAAHRGRVVSFRIAGPWVRPRSATQSGSVADKIAFVVTAFGMFAALGLLGRRNIRLGRSDLQGARRVGLYIFAAQTVGVLIGFRYLSDPQIAFFRFILRVGMNMFLGIMIFAAYVALEPYVRKMWPRVLISWTRLLAGRWRDPQVGRDVLIGAAAGTLTRLLAVGHTLLPPLLGLPDEPLATTMNPGVVDLRASLAIVFNQAAGSVAVPMLTLVVLVVLRLVLRRSGLAIGALFVAAVAIRTIGTTHLALDMVLHSAVMGLTLFVLMRWGLMAAVGMWFFDWIGGRVMTVDPSAWTGPSTLVFVGVLLLVAGYAAFTALGGRAFLEDATMTEPAQ